VTVTEAAAVADALVTARRLRLRLDARPVEARSLRRLEVAIEQAAEDGEAEAARAAIGEWTRLVRRVLDSEPEGKRVTGRPSEIGFARPDATTAAPPRSERRRR
jgi:hypothetical protein